jgi:hypothetical protein
MKRLGGARGRLVCLYHSSVKSEQERHRFLAEAIRLARAMIADPGSIAKHTYDFHLEMMNVHWSPDFLPPELARPLCEAAAAGGHHSVQSYALISLARGDPATALPIACDLMGTASESRVWDAAAEAWLLSQRLPEPFDMAGRIPDRDLLQWPLPAQHIYVLVDLINQVRMNGFSGWCCNGYASRWRLTIDACRAVGASTCAGLVERTAAAFGPTEKLSDEEIAATLCDTQSKRIQRALGKLDGLFWGDPDRLRCLMAEYMVKHGKLFAAMRPI